MKRDLFLENIKLAIASVKAQKLRTWLTALIISFGIMALVGILSATDAIKQSLEGNFSSLGANTFTIKSSNSGFSIHFGGKKPKAFPKITYKEALRFKERFQYQKSIVSVSYIVTGTAEIKNKRAKSDPNVQIWSVDAPYFTTAGYEIGEGRNFTEVEVNEGRPVAIIGQDIVEKVFDGEKPLGKLISYKGKRLLVIGVLSSKGSSGIFSGDRVVFVPLAYGRKSLSTANPSYAINVMSPNRADLDASEGETIAMMRSVRKLNPKEENNFRIERSDSLAQSLLENLKFVTMGAFLIGMIALFSAAIALMNIMLVSVTERTREIGTRKAIGAKANTIMGQFLTEAILICQLGGVIGVILGLIIGNSVAAMVGGTFFIPYTWIITALIICIFVGIFAGLYPAVKASRQNPIDALRYE